MVETDTYGPETWWAYWIDYSEHDGHGHDWIDHDKIKRSPIDNWQIGRFSKLAQLIWNFVDRCKLGWISQCTASHNLKYVPVIRIDWFSSKIGKLPNVPLFIWNLVERYKLGWTSQSGVGTWFWLGLFFKSESTAQLAFSLLEVLKSVIKGDFLLIV
jgi:hypothetical protein